MRSPISRRLAAGERLPAHATSSGQVLLGCLPATELAGYLKLAPFERLTQWTLTDADQLVQAIAQVSAQGYAMASEQLELGVCGLAVPVKDRSGATVAALTTSLSLAKHQASAIVSTFLPKLQDLAQQIGRGIAD
ncbi:Pca operon regulatory protein [compost metagenome]